MSFEPLIKTLQSKIVFRSLFSCKYVAFGSFLALGHDMILFVYEGLDVSYYYFHVRYVHTSHSGKYVWYVITNQI